MDKKRKISIIGSTGSIGTQALEVIAKLQGKFEIVKEWIAQNGLFW